ncbi:sigma 54-interacting transcriptional regulator [Polluticoccus soli]|uniref:sigma 54-interacting transcriptional regulator n=1 Tax=Polluticoccus soli TaxID=3034150 RepID=UPI0023E2A690|nr:sigma 54-interacting transcriptional regulator [Flavipsychrobacter sp. JY13-12]
MQHPAISTLGQLIEAGYTAKTVKEEVRHNLIRSIQEKQSPFKGILGYEDSVIPDVERAILSRHNILFLGLRGQAKTRMAREMVSLLDEWIPVIAGSEINDSPFAPISLYARNLLAEKGNDTPIAWLHRSERYGEKLATPDVSVADLIGDVDPIKAANLRLSFADEQVIHYGIIPRSHRGIFVINELPDLQARIQVSLFNILQEGDIQIRGFKLRLPLDILFVFTANPEDYTNRGSIVTPLKDRIESQIITHYPRTVEVSKAITEQEADVLEEQLEKVDVPDLGKMLIEQIAMEARKSEYVDQKSGVSARLTISAYENLVSTAERRALKYGSDKTMMRLADFVGVIPSITGKIELVYEGEQEGALNVAYRLLGLAIRSVFTQYFPDPQSFKKAGGQKSKPVVNPYQSVIDWFGKGNELVLLQDSNDETYRQKLYEVDGLYAAVKQYYPKADEVQAALLMEFLLHGLSEFSLISKKGVVSGGYSFADMLGSMLNIHLSDEDDEEEEEDF